MKYHLKYHINVHLKDYSMNTTISIKELRNNMSAIANRAEEGNIFVVIRHSKPSFKIIPYAVESDDGEWETVVDFTEGGKKKGAKIEDVLKAFKRLNKG